MKPPNNTLQSGPAASIVLVQTSRWPAAELRR